MMDDRFSFVVGGAHPTPDRTALLNDRSMTLNQSGQSATIDFEFVFWKEEGGWLGYVCDFPRFWTQGESFDDLIEHLKDLRLELTSGRIALAC